MTEDCVLEGTAFCEAGRLKGREEIIQEIEIFKAEIEWDRPLDYQIVLEELLQRLKSPK